MTVFYAIILAISFVFPTLYLFIWRKHFNLLLTMMFIFVPIVNLGYYLLASAGNLDSALIANKLTYIGGCYLSLIVMLTVFSLCDIKINKYIGVLLFVISTVIFGFSLTIGYSSIFYKSVEYAKEYGAAYLKKEYGVMHTFFYIMFISYIVASLGAVIYCYFKKNQTSRRTITLIFLSEIIGLIGFFGGRIVKSITGLPVDLTPLAYVIDLAIFLIIIHRVSLYDIEAISINSMVENGEIGFIALDMKLNYLGSNHIAKEIIPELNSLIVDKKISNDDVLLKYILVPVGEFSVNNKSNKVYYEKDDKIFLITIDYLSSGNKKVGYRISINDDTKNQEYIKLLNSFNDELKREVDDKTKHLLLMHDNFILAIATMVESRDNSTGGHIKRTSQGVKFLIEEMKKDDEINLSYDFCKNIIKAAPMHDLGKIAVDDAILRKPGKFTPEEFEKMKVHSAEGAKIINEILSESDDPEFKKIAMNVAHYHHERIDGSGYPDGLKGDEIPLEARIMAIADVYDALVSKRVYKEKMSFSEAYKIIMNGMGTQFDKKLEKYFVNALPKLEKYYSEIDC